MTCHCKLELQRGLCYPQFDCYKTRKIHFILEFVKRVNPKLSNSSHHPGRTAIKNPVLFFLVCNSVSNLMTNKKNTLIMIRGVISVRPESATRAPSLQIIVARQS